MDRFFKPDHISHSCYIKSIILHRGFWNNELEVCNRGRLRGA